MVIDYHTATPEPGHRPEILRGGFHLPLLLTCPYCGHAMTYRVKFRPGTNPPPRFIICGDDDGHGCYEWFVIRAKLFIEAHVQTFKVGEQDIGDDPFGECSIKSVTMN